MKYLEKQTITTEVVIAITCDVCQTYYTQPVELQGFYHLRKTGSYGNLFGGGAVIECDLCQHCLKARLGDVLRLKPLSERACGERIDGESNQKMQHSYYAV